MSNCLAYAGWKDPLWEERINGKPVLMSPASPRHNRIAGNIFLAFGAYLKGKNCVPFHDGTAVHLTEQNHFIPDFMVVCDRSKIKSQWVDGAPDLVVEVLSRSTAKNDRFFKKDIYESNGVPEYWIVSPSDQSVEVYLLQNGAYTLNNLYTLYTDDELAVMPAAERSAVVTEFKCHLYHDLTIRLEDIFSDLF